MISTKQLMYFDAVARLKHFGRAAEERAITQPALSMQIQELERELGVVLVERGRTIRLTDAGTQVAARTAHILDQINGLTEFAATRRAPLTGKMRLGVIPSIGPYILPAVLAQVQAHYPQLELRIRETLTDYLLAQLDDGTLDVALLALPVDAPGLDTIELFGDRFLLATPKGGSKPGRRKATLDDLEAAPLLLLEEGHCLREQALNFCSLRSIDNADSFGASSLSTLVQMVAAGMGQTLLPEMSVAVEASRNDVRVQPFQAPEPSRTIGLAFRKASPLKADFEALATLIKNVRQKTPA